MRRRLLAIGILLAWGAGIAAYLRREARRSPREKLAEAAVRVAPGATYFAVELAGRHVGFASNTVDTVPGGLRVTDYLVADLALGGTVQRATAQSVVQLSRGLALRTFTMTFGTDTPSVRAEGRTLGDTLLEYVVQAAGARGDTVRVPLAGPLLLPTLVPLAVALGESPRVGRRYAVETFDPTTMAPRTLGVSIRAESSFVVLDSAVYDGAARRWRGVHADTVHALHVTGEDAGGFDAWVDDLGRMLVVQAPAGLRMRRMAYELAFENWRMASPARGGPATSPASDLWQATALAAGAAVGARPLDSLRVRVRGIDPARFAVDGDGQRLAGDTLTIARATRGRMRAPYSLPPDRSFRGRHERFLRREPLLEVDDPAIAALARRIAAGERRPDVVAERLVRWVHDSLAKDPQLTIPSAVATLRSRRGDCNEHAQLLVALARAAGIPARAASGVVAVDGRFYYHAWAELWLQDWVAVDPTFGQWPADAAHVRLVSGGLSLYAELARVIGRLGLAVVAAHPSASPP